MAEKAIATFGQIDVLANNAGHGLVGTIEETSDSEAQKMLDTNFLGNLRVTRNVIVKRGGRTSILIY